MRLPALSLVLGLAALSLLAGCHKRLFTRDHFEMIQVGVDNREDVQHILGKPAADLTDQWQYDDGKRHYSAVIHFDADGRVSAKEWMDAKTGAWEGRNPNTNEPPEGEVRERHKKTTRIDED
jgi:outer membrane protein assembly factor BamE (lipoprotein component of BamABCDE complex)